MLNNFKNKKGESALTQGGFLKLIIFIVIALFIMKYLKISLNDVFNWFKTVFSSVF